ncbi:caspase-9-like isoform X2 [Acropora muricata]|uniref:caspase-9-like isoform X2 n=1 Tax=Acropora muricata TaxID=159855 RepID=UPI0034E4A6A5
MIPCQVSTIAEICICHGKICETVLRYKTTSKINRSPSLTTDTQEARIPIADESATKLNINKDISIIMQGIKFDDPQSAVAFRGIAEAFPSLSNAIRFQCSSAPFQRETLVSVQEISLKDNYLEAVTLSGDRLSIKNRSRNGYQNSSLQEVKLPIRKPMSERDVGDLILLSLDPDEPTWLTCTGILLSGESECYKMESRPRGLCLIINNMSFRDQNLHRLGANFDEQKLHDLFEKLHFEVCVFKDQHKYQMEWICASYGGVDHSQYDAFVCIIMSHGTSGDKIMGVDGRTIGIEDLMSEFNAVRCPSLANKPKLFLVQACRGSEEGEFPGPNDQQIADNTFSDSTLSRSRLPKESDFLLAYSSVPGYVSFRMPDSGSFFIQTLVDVFEKKHHKDHLEDMLIEVRRKVSGTVCQVSPSHTTLRYKVLL